MPSRRAAAPNTERANVIVADRRPAPLRWPSEVAAALGVGDDFVAASSTE